VPIEDVEGIRKVKWDEMWHVLYEIRAGITYRNSPHDRTDCNNIIEILIRHGYTVKEENFELVIIW